MKKSAVFSTFVLAGGMAMLLMAPAAVAQPCSCMDGDLVCCRGVDAQDPEGSLGEVPGAVGGTDPVCGGIYLDDENYVAGRLDPFPVGCIVVAGQNGGIGLEGVGCTTDGARACLEGGCADVTPNAPECGGGGGCTDDRPGMPACRVPEGVTPGPKNKP